METDNKFGQIKDKMEIGLSDMEKFLKRYELNKLSYDFFEKISLLVIASLGFVSAIAWDQLLKLIISNIFESVDSIWGKLIYAIIVTILATIISIILGKLIIKKKKQKYEDTTK